HRRADPAADDQRLLSRARRVRPHRGPSEGEDHHRHQPRPGSHRPGADRSQRGGEARRRQAGAGEMIVEPEYPAFEQAYQAGRPQLVWTRLIDDLETPVSAYLKIGHGRPYAFLYESVEGGAFRARYSIIT